ncbi:MAG: hypothetical protein ACNI3A_01285 [Desulfovibrio sp.]|uniref:hypothetical protein n=1 Tax=Desulfovibrio sp. 7SRBS1 TaxID=3378064 RepID=UPI003B41C09A
MLRRDWFCRVLLEWERAHDEFIDRAECFNLPDAQAGALWERLFLSMQGKCSRCDEYEAGGDLGEAIDCRHFVDGLCLKALPVCEGICREFTPMSIQE